MTLKILILSDYPPPNGIIRGGIPRAVCNIVAELCKLDQSIEFHVCTFSSDVRSNITNKIDNLFIHYIRLPIANYPIIIPNFLVQTLVRNAIKEIKPDLIHLHGISKYCIYPLVKLGFNPTIITVHGVIHEESKTWNGVFGRYRAIVGRRLENYILRNAQHLIVVTPYVKNIIKSDTSSEISIIYNPVDEKFFNIKKNEVKNRILFVGGIEPRKGLQVLIEALKIVKKDIPDIMLHIVGNIRRRDYYKKILKNIKDDDLSKNIIFNGAISEEELIQEYSEAEIFILPSQEESLGIVLLEAMATGTSIIASNIGGIPYIIKDGLNGFLVDFGDYAEMAKYILVLLSDMKKRNAMGIVGKDMAKKFHPKIIAMEHLQLYEKLLRVNSQDKKNI